MKINNNSISIGVKNVLGDYESCHSSNISIEEYLRIRTQVILELKENVEYDKQEEAKEIPNGKQDNQTRQEIIIPKKEIKDFMSEILEDFQKNFTKEIMDNVSKSLDAQNETILNLKNEMKKTTNTNVSNETKPNEAKTSENVVHSETQQKETNIEPQEPSTPPMPPTNLSANMPVDQEELDLFNRLKD